MMQLFSALKGFAIEATDGRLGTVGDFLFEDDKWKVRWLVIDCGVWLTGRKVLIHPSAISHADFAAQQFEMTLTKSQVESSPELREDQPVSQQMERRLHAYYHEQQRIWAGPYIGGIPGGMTSAMMAPPDFVPQTNELRADVTPSEGDDPHLRSAAEVIGYRINAIDGEIGHVENVMIDDKDWSLSYFVIDTRNWWFGTRVLISTISVKAIDWFERRLQVDVSREQVKSSPLWDPLVAFDQIYAKQIHRHYGWPGSGV